MWNRARAVGRDADSLDDATVGETEEELGGAVLALRHLPHGGGTGDGGQQSMPNRKQAGRLLGLSRRG